MKFYRGDNEGKQSRSWKFGCCQLTWEIHLYQPITVGCLEGCDKLLHRLIEVNFSKLTDSNQIFRIDYVCLLWWFSRWFSALIFTRRSVTRLAGLGIYVFKFISQITYPKLILTQIIKRVLNERGGRTMTWWAKLILNKKNGRRNSRSFPSNKMIISQTYMVIIIFPDYNAPISIHGPD